MRRTYGVPLARAGLGGLLVALLLLGHPGTSIAGGESESTRGAANLGGAPLERGAGYGAADGADRVRALQRALRSLGWAPGRVDGLFGPRTESAVMRLQQATGLEADGIVGPRTRGAIRGAHEQVLRRGAGYAQAGGAARVRELQRELRRRGLRPGAVDGRFGPRTEAAVARLQRAVRLPAHGVVDTTTRRVLARTGEPAWDIPIDSRRDNGRTGMLRVVPVAVSPEEADTAATVALPLAAVAVVAALMLGALLPLLFARRSAVAGASIPLVNGVVAEGPTRVRDRARAAPAAEPRVEAVRALGYVTVPHTAGRDDARLRKQARGIDALCEKRGWRLVEVVRDVERDTGRGRGRPGLQYALERIEKGEVSCLVVCHLGRLTRSVRDLGRILEALNRHGGRLVAMDVGLDTGSPDGGIAADALMSVGVWERRRLGERTRKGLAAARASGAATGRPAVSDVPALKERIVAMRLEGMTLQAIADQLNDDGVPTVRGGTKWRPSSVQAAAGYRRPGGRRRQAAPDGPSEGEA
jgi:peptidoglycan hydrolase-like protein with peptidoglycan-binding domain/DNA invertase Pin-like site-specific DNA recombinase